MMPLLTDEAACDGYRQTSGKLLGLCVACDRLGAHWQDTIEPEACRQPCGEWACINRRYTAPEVTARGRQP